MGTIKRSVVALLFAMAGTTAMAQPREGVEVGKNSAFTKLVPAEQVERSAAQQYAQMLSQANSKKALGGKDHPQVRRLRGIARRIIPFALPWNARARDWQWEVNLIDSSQINAFCMPGGKIAFYTGILDKLQLSDDEVAMVMGHEIAHALREHARERMGKTAVTHGAAQIGGALLSSIFGINPNLTDMATRGAANLLTLEFSREDESEADLVGMDLAARAGFDPRSGVSLWQKMGAAQGAASGQQSQVAQFFSTHPSGKNRIAEIQANLPKVMPLYERAAKIH